MSSFYGRGRHRFHHPICTCRKLSVIHIRTIHVENLLNLCIKAIGKNYDFCNKSLTGLIPSELIEKINESATVKARYRNIYLNNRRCVYQLEMIPFVANVCIFRTGNHVDMTLSEWRYELIIRRSQHYYIPSRFNHSAYNTRNYHYFIIDDELDQRLNKIWFEYISMRSSNSPHFCKDIRACPYID
jgi:hypothetical protein